MLFSVVISTHHRESLKKTWDSLEKQTFKNFEVIIVPSPFDANSDWLASLKKSSTIEITVLSSNEDPYQGKSASYKRNRGSQQARGDWIAFIDDDCVADPDWLKNAETVIQQKNPQAIEGFTKIPKLDKPTLTSKGLARLSLPGGYQTCNMFYKKSEFLRLNGFDLNFPFYLEDTDLAWSFLDNGKSIVFAENCIVSHPVPPPEVRRLLDNAIRTEKIPYLYKKHPLLFKKNHFKALQRIHWIYLFVYLFLLGLLFYKMNIYTLLFSLYTILKLTAFYTTRQLLGCQFSLKELFSLFLYYPIVPLVSFFQLWRGNIKQGVIVWK